MKLIGVWDKQILTSRECVCIVTTLKEKTKWKAQADVKHTILMLF